MMNSVVFASVVGMVMGMAGQAMAGNTGSGSSYSLMDDYNAGNWNSMFNYFTAADPTHGLVDYVSESAAQNAGLLELNPGAIYMGVDHTNVVGSGGRPSVRVTSNKAYNHGLFIIDLVHMPNGCGTWPAFWLVGPNWPASGEIDIIEGVHLSTTNSMTLHTASGCSITNNNQFGGKIATGNCDVNAAGQDNNAGCGITTGNTLTYGAGFNNNGGGVYATEWTSDFIKIWFFPRQSIPSDISSGNPSPSNWGEPVAMFQGGCNIDNYFMNQQIVFDTTFCGDWAGNTWSSTTCASQASTCNAFVQNNPSAFTEAYWNVTSLKVYSQSGSSSPHPSSSAWSTSSAIPQTTFITSSIPAPPVSTQTPTLLSSSAITTPAPVSSSDSTSSLSSRTWTHRSWGGRPNAAADDTSADPASTSTSASTVAPSLVVNAMVVPTSTLNTSVIASSTSTLISSTPVAKLQALSTSASTISSTSAATVSVSSSLTPLPSTFSAITTSSASVLPTSTTTNIVVVTEYATAVVYVTVTPTPSSFVTVTPTPSSSAVSDYGYGTSESSTAGDYGYGSTSQPGTIKNSEMAGEDDFAGGIPVGATVAKRGRHQHSHKHRHPQVLA